MADVRIYSYPSLMVAAVNPSSGRPSSDSVFLLKEPYLAGEVLAPDTLTADSSDAATAPSETKMLKVQVQPGKRVYYEVTPGGQTLRLATSSSPIISGDETLFFGSGYRISFLEVA